MIKYLQHHAVHVYEDGGCCYEDSSTDKECLFNNLFNHYTFLKPYESDIDYFGSIREFIGEREYIVIFTQIKINSVFGVK